MTLTDATAQERAIEIAKARDHKTLPDMPAVCKEAVTVSVEKGQRLDEVLLRALTALDRANDKTAYCAEWYEGVQQAYE